jgi:KDO2-lipid IV(A) lauroyltransferase
LPAAWLFIATEWVVSHLPLRPTAAFAGAVGAAVGVVAPLRRRVMTENLASAFPEMTAAERRRLMRRHCSHLGRWVVEFLNIPRLNAGSRGIVFTVDGQDHLDEVLAERRETGQGFIVVTGHIGSWELAACHIAREGLPFTALGKPVHNPTVNRHLADTRAGVGLKVMFTRRAQFTEIVKRLRDGEIITVAADQDDRQFGTFVDFLGRPASTPRGPAMCALRSGRPILPVFTVRERGLHHRIIHCPAIRPPESPEDVDRAVQELTQAYTRELEALVRRWPEQYLWLHRRWKTRPESVKARRRRRAGLPQAAEPGLAD